MLASSLKEMIKSNREYNDRTSANDKSDGKNPNANDKCYRKEYCRSLSRERSIDRNLGSKYYERSIDRNLGSKYCKSLRRIILETKSTMIGCEKFMGRCVERDNDRWRQSDKW